MAHVEKRGKTSWRLVVTIGYDNKGIPIRERKTVQAKNKTEAEKLLTIFESTILQGEYVKPERMTFEDLYREWNDNTTVDDIAVRTKEEYIKVIEQRLIPKYGHMNIADIKPIHVQNFVKSLGRDGARLNGQTGGLSTSTINNYYNAFNSVLKFAKRMTWISNNPAENVEPPTERYEDAKIYNSQQISKLLLNIDKMAMDYRHKVLLYVALSSSARQGEIAALEEKHCDFERSGVHINQALTVKKSVGVAIKETKNKSKRFITLPSSVMDMIKKLIHIRKQELLAAGNKRVWEDHLFLFGDEFGRPIRPDSISQWWRRFVNSERFKSIGLDTIRFHDLRHSSLTFISQMGARPKLVQERAGHARIGTTFDIYGHALPEEDQEAASFIENMFPNQNKAGG